MSDPYHDSNDEPNFPDFSFLKKDNSLNASENVIDTNTNKISTSLAFSNYNLPYIYKGIELPGSYSLQSDDSARCVNSSGIKSSDVDCINNISTTTFSDAFYSDKNNAGNWKFIESKSNDQLGNFNKNFKNFSYATDLEAICPDYLSSVKSKGVNIPSNDSLLFEDSARAFDSVKSKTYNDPSSVDIPVVPKKPLITMQNCFACGLSLKPNELINRIDDALLEKVEMSFEFDLKNFLWNAVYIKGSAHCKFRVNVYSEKDCLLVEIHKLSGDSLTFHSIAKDIKNTITGNKQEIVESMFPVSSIQPCDVLSDSDAFAAIEVFKEMAAEPFVESQLEASRILCDLSQQEGMQHILRDSGCIQILVNLATFGGTEWTRQHAVLALANLSSSLCCQESIIDAGVLPALLTLATDGPYHSAAMRRESARLLANISERLAARVMAVLGKQEVSKWFDSMDTFRDGTLRVHAQRARSSLSIAIAATS